MDDSELNEAGNDDNVDMTIDIPLPDVGITEEDGVASELSDGKDIQTTFPQLEPEEDVSENMLSADAENGAEPEEDTSNETAISGKMQCHCMKVMKYLRERKNLERI